MDSVKYVISTSLLPTGYTHNIVFIMIFVIYIVVSNDKKQENNK
jgi:hypothetical protein